MTVLAERLSRPHLCLLVRHVDHLKHPSNISLMSHPLTASLSLDTKVETAFLYPIPFQHAQFRIGGTCMRYTNKRPRAPLTKVSPRAKYTPSEDDRADSTSNVPTELTLAQQLLMKQYEEQIGRMSTEECQKLAVEIARQMMVKDNIMRKMLKTDVNFGIEPPDPEDFQTPEMQGK